MKITVFDLLKLVIENKAPKEIKYDTMNYVFRNYDYKEVHGGQIDEQSSWLEKIDFYKFDEQVEILEEPKGIPEKLKWNEKSQHNVVTDNTKKTLEHLLSRSEQLKKSVNQIIDYLDYLKSKGEQV